MDVVDALGADGIVAVVGAGGKKTTLFALADRLDRGVVTATVRIPIFDDHVAQVAVTDHPAAAVAAADDWPIGVVPGREARDGADRYLGYDTVTVDAFADEVGDAVDAVLVKADGARTRWLKAPNDREPQVPSSADTVVAVASARVVGEPLTQERVHRPDRVAAVTGLDRGGEIRAEHVARVLASDRGGLKDVPPDATAVALVNMVDDAALEATGREIAERIHALADRFDRVVLARMDDPRVVDVIR